MKQEQTARNLVTDAPLHRSAKTMARRRLWEHSRALLEAVRIDDSPDKHLTWKYQAVFDGLLAVFGKFLRLISIYDRGVANALDIKLNTMDLWFPNLPEIFNGYRILHLSDLHLDATNEIGGAIVSTLKGVQADICVMTGDYREALVGPFDQILPSLAMIIQTIKTPDGIFATLGNHDDHQMARAFERMNFPVLANETITVKRENKMIAFTGVDDVNRFYTPAADEALGRAAGDFSIALVHSPEIAQVAADGGYSLYLCGHTHGGQICLPGNRPLITHLKKHKKFANGIWRCGEMIGYTSPGIGVSGLPVRFFSRGEATLITLRRRNRD